MKEMALSRDCSTLKFEEFANNFKAKFTCPAEIKVC